MYKYAPMQHAQNTQLLSLCDCCPFLMPTYITKLMQLASYRCYSRHIHNFTTTSNPTSSLSLRSPTIQRTQICGSEVSNSHYHHAEIWTCIIEEHFLVKAQVSVHEQERENREVTKHQQLLNVQCDKWGKSLIMIHHVEENNHANINFIFKVRENPQTVLEEQGESTLCSVD